MTTHFNTHPAGVPNLTPVTMSLDDVRAAAERLHPYISKTPVVWSERLHAWLKLENLQLTGSYKVRGALHALLRRQQRAPVEEVVAASAGNHAQGVAWAAHRLGLRATVVMPRHAPLTKRRGTERYGAQVLCEGSTFEDAQRIAQDLARARRAYFLAPFDDPDVIAGQGTVGIELMSMAPDVVLVPIGGGGLASGVGLALKPSGARVIGVQIEGVDGMARCLHGREPLTQAAPTIADGVRVATAGRLTSKICRSVLDDVVLVTEREVRSAIVRLAEDAGIVAEGAGALAVAGLTKISGERSVAVVSGGNIDLQTLAPLLAENDRRTATPSVQDTFRHAAAR